MRMFLIAGPTAAMLLAAPACAEITLKEVQYEAGILVVAGDTTHRNRDISLDGRFTETSDQAGAFRFRIEYLPDDCTISLFDGEDTRTASIRGCRIKDAIDLGVKRERGVGH
jgi:hypothetical protein